VIRPAPRALSRREYEALVFDLDGVVTSTAALHAAAWKRLFDEYLPTRPARAGEDRSPLLLPDDYLQHVDGKPRADGVRDFLASRGIRLPEGSPDDGPDAATIHGLGARKDGYYHELLTERGVEVFQGTVDLIRSARKAGFRVAIASSSRNCAQVLETAGLEALFDTRFDGNDLAAQGLPGKPDPGMFIAAAQRLGVDPARAVVFEDATSGVEAGRRGGFALVVGVNRGAAADALRRNGADVVVEDLSELEVRDDAA